MNQSEGDDIVGSVFFLNNKYLRIYLQLVEKAKSRQNLEEIERHHVMPRSLGGSNKKTNIVALSPREHFICHLLLTKMTTGEARKKMVFAARYMLVTRSGEQVSSRKYEHLKAEYRIAASEALRGRSFSPESKAKMSIAQQKSTNYFVSGNSKGSKTEKHCTNISNGKRGKSTNWSTPENRQAVSNALKGRKKTAEHQAKITQALKGKPSPLRGRPSILKGISLSEETKEKMRKPKSEEMKRKLREFYAAKRAAKSQ